MLNDNDTQQDSKVGRVLLDTLLYGERKMLPTPKIGLLRPTHDYFMI